MSGYFRSVDPLGEYYTLDYFKSEMLETPTQKSTIFLHKGKPIPSTETTFFYCNHFNEVGEKGYCNSNCEGYQPRNGKGGICKHYRNLLEDSGECYLLRHYGNGTFRLEHVKLEKK